MLYNNLRSAALLVALPTAWAQTYTSCNPLSSTCPADQGLAQSQFNTDFTSGSYSGWSGYSPKTGSNGAEFTITADGQAPTLNSDFYIFFGRVDVVMRAAPGIGIVSSIVLESDDLDEIDWEFLGGDTVEGQTNFFGKGDTSSYDRGTVVPIATPQSTWHTYSVDWTADQIQWLVDGNVVRTLPYASSQASGGAKYPQTPARVKLGNWVAGGANNAAGTVQWAGGKTDFSQAPFTMYVKSIAVTNYNPASSYTYGDHSGSWQSIQKSGAVAGASSQAVVVASSSTTLSTSTVATTSAAPVTSLSTTTMAQRVVTVDVSSSASTTSTTTAPTTTSTGASSRLPSSGFLSSSRTSSSASTTYTEPARQTGNSASSVSISAGGSLLCLAAAFFMF